MSAHRYRVRWQFGEGRMHERVFRATPHQTAVVRATRFGKEKVLEGADVVSVLPITHALTRREETRAS